jgi:uncharacterized protein
LPRAAAVPATVDITAASLNLAQGCNMRCTYCFAGEGDYGKKAMMSFATARRALEQLAAGKPRFHVIFFGGEPMLNFRVIEQVVAWCEAQTATKFSFAMTTNGTLLTAEKLAWLKAKQFKLTISYDGKGLHARQRFLSDKKTTSEGLVQRKLDAFAADLQALRSFTLRATVEKANLDVLEEAMLSTLTARNYQLYLSTHSATIKELGFGLEDVARLGAIYRRVVDRLLEAGDWRQLLRLDNLKSHLVAVHRGRRRALACGAGTSYLTVSAEGAFYLCHRFNEDETERFGDVERGADTARLQAFAEQRTAPKEPCASCWMREWCAGGCFYEHKASTGDVFAPSPAFCRLMDLEMTEALRVYTILREKAPEIVATL